MDEYPKRALKLFEDVMKLFHSIPFGTEKEQVNPESFKPLTPELILNTLENILKRIKAKEARIGTLSANNNEDTSRNYSSKP